MSEHDDTPEDAAYRRSARTWLAEHAAEYREQREFPEDELVARSRAWIRKKWETGYSAIAAPKEAGGAGGSRRQAAIFAEEEAHYFTPTFIGVGIGFAMAMDAIRKHGTLEQYCRFGLPTHRGDVSWCQLFSEPAAGSDLAAVRTRAVRDGDNWIVNGQKVWSSWAHHARYGILLARTDPSVVKHKGLTFFVCDMHAPGVTVRPIRQITGKSDFNETFLTDVVIPDDCRIGAEGEGWAVAMTVLATERNQSGPSRSGDDDITGSVRNLLRRARDAQRGEGSALDSAAIRARLAQFHIQEQGLKHFGARLQAKLARGEPPPPTLALMKLVSASKLQQTHAFLMDLEEFGGLFSEPDHSEREDIFYQYLWSAAMRIAGGADEVLRNQLAERALGMPSEMRADKDVPFDKLPS
jgi:alkylation response protein AidB-like acyl-CoA dehydrogenase